VNDSVLLVLAFVASTVRISVPYALAAVGGTMSERGGVINIALEGMMLAGAFTAAAVTVFTHSPWAGLLAAVIAGLVVAALHAVVTINYRADQVVSGAAINILFLGVPALLSGALFESTGATPQLPRDQTMPNTLVYLAFILVAVTAYVIYRTRFGLRLRAVGENPEAAMAAGVSVTRMRYAGVLISGALAALGGAYLSIGQSSLFTRNMTAGRGFIALAALIFGKWDPVGALLACLFFGFAEAVAIRMQGTVDIPNQFIQMIPYVLTMVVLAGWIGRATPPKALGTPYVKE
jgi:Uncharacterized ABC-type transport system, permease component